jgi:hypothetical protein
MEVDVHPAGVAARLAADAAKPSNSPHLAPKLLVLREMSTPLVGGAGNRPHEATLAHVSEGRGSRI